MLKRALQVAIPYAKNLSEEGYLLSVNQASSLGRLTALSAPDTDLGLVPEEEFVDAVTFATESKEMVTEFEQFFQKEVEELSDLTLSHINITQAVSAMCSSIAAKVATNASEIAAKSNPAENFQVVTDNLHSIFQIQVIQDMVAGPRVFKDANYCPRLVSSNRSNAEIQGLFKMAGGAKDKALLSLFDSYGGNFGEEVYYALVASGVCESRYRAHVLSMTPPAERAAVYLMAALICEELREAVPADAVGTLSNFEANVTEARDTYITNCFRALQEYNAMVENEQLIVSYRTYGEDKMLAVNGPTYTKFLQSGGRVEIVLGAYLAHIPYLTLSEFGERVDACVRAWNAYCSTSSLDSAVQRSELLRSLWSMAQSEAIADMLDFEKDYRASNPQHAQWVLDETNRVLIGKSLEELENVDQMAIDLIAGIRFKYLAAEDILRDANRVALENPEIPAREAFLVAAINYVIGYELSQIVVDTPRQ